MSVWLTFPLILTHKHSTLSSPRSRESNPSLTYSILPLLACPFWTLYCHALQHSSCDCHPTSHCCDGRSHSFPAFPGFQLLLCSAHAAGIGVDAVPLGYWSHHLCGQNPQLTCDHSHALLWFLTHQLCSCYHMDFHPLRMQDKGPHDTLSLKHWWATPSLSLLSLVLPPSLFRYGLNFF